MKQYKEKAMLSRATHSTQVSHHHHVLIDTGSNLELDNYGSSLPSRPADYMFDKDTSSDSGNGFENLCRD
jgi:hypothetical protein